MVPDLLLDLFPGGAACVQRALAAAEVIVPGSDRQPVKTLQTRRTEQHHTQPQLIPTGAPRFAGHTHPGAQLRVAAVALDLSQVCRRGVRLPG
jgi:hypothetical protein